MYDVEWLYSMDNRLTLTKSHRIFDIQTIERLLDENKLKYTNKRIDDIEADLRTLIDKMERVEQSITNLNHKIKQKVR